MDQQNGAWVCAAWYDYSTGISLGGACVNTNFGWDRGRSGRTEVSERIRQLTGTGTRARGCRTVAAAISLATTPRHRPRLSSPGAVRAFPRVVAVLALVAVLTMLAGPVRRAQAAYILLHPGYTEHPWA